MVIVLARSAQHSWVSIAVVVFLALCLPGIWMSFGLAQVAPITPSGLNTQVSAPINVPAGTQYNITGGTRPGAGPNLFHSFGQFGVPTTNIANFLNETALPTSNILGRVTGGNPSNIFGTIQTSGFGNANLFLMNPAGFLFGPTATVNVGGMATFTTADYLRLVDGKLFHATPNPAADTLLSTAPVAAFGFLGSNPGAIRVEGGQLSVANGQGIALVGGNITVQNGVLENGSAQPAHLSAPGGRIHLASAGSSGEFLAGTLDQAPNVNGQSFGALGTIQVSQKSVVDASGDGGGTVLIRGGRFVIDDSRISANTSGPATGQFMGTPGEGIDIQVTQDAAIRNAAVLETNVTGDFVTGVGSGGVRIRADRITVLGTPGSLENFGMETLTAIKSATQGAGNAGNIILRATGNIEIVNVVSLDSTSGFDSTGTVGSPTRASGNAGNIELTSTHGNILMTEGGRATLVTSQTLNSSGNAGKVTASAPEGDIVLDGANLFTQNNGSGGAGQVEITAKNLRMNAGLFSTDNAGPFKPEGITMTLSGNFTMEGNSFISTVSVNPTSAADISITAKDVVVTQGSLITSATFASGPGGHLRIVADTLQITDGSQVASGSTIAPAAPGLPEGFIPTGPGGDITIQALAGLTGSVLIDGAGSGIFTNAEGTGAGGKTNVTAQSVTIQNGGTISASTSGIAPSATGGSITISTGQLALNTSGSITADSSGPANAGTVTVQGLASPATSVLINGAGSGIRTDTTGTGAGGDISLTAQSVTLQNGSTLSASSSGTAPSATGGTITISADQLVTLNNDASITASSTGPANAGDIVINAGQNFSSTNSAVTTEAAQASGGNITVTAADLIQLTNSQINASVEGSTTTVGGDITIDPQFVILQNSQIIAQATQGQGGNISITTNALVPDATSLIDASSQTGISGTVRVQSPEAPAAGKIVPLSKSPLPATALLGERCAAVEGGLYSSFVVAGHYGLPTEPGGWLASPLAVLGADAGLGAREGTNAAASLTQATEIVALRQLPSAGRVTPIVSTDWMAGCGS